MKKFIFSRFSAVRAGNFTADAYNTGGRVESFEKKDFHSFYFFPFERGIPYAIGGQSNRFSNQFD